MYGDNVTDDLLRASRALMTSADLVAAAVMRRMDPPKDAISLNQAERKYGRAWIRGHLDAGHLTNRRTGGAKNSKIILSCLEIESLRTAESQIVASIKEKYKRGPVKIAAVATRKVKNEQIMNNM